MPRPDRTVIESLRARIWALERGRAAEAAAALPVAPAVDAALPWGGLPLACMHEVIAADAAGAAFCAVLAGRLAARGAVLWCAGRGDLYVPGLAAFGLPAERLILVRPPARDVLWAMEEGLRCPHLGAVVAEARGLDLKAGRRLQLAAEAGRVTGFLLLPPDGRPAGAAATRWRVAAAPSGAVPWGGLGPARWRVDLERCRNGAPGSWLMEWNDATGRLAMAAEPLDGSADPAARRLRRLAG